MFESKALIVTLFAVAFIGVAVVTPFRRRYRDVRRVTLFASALLVIGAAGFFAPMLYAFGALNWLPQSVEWPVGSADGVVWASGWNVVPHRHAGRVQVYDRDWRFVRGWAVPGGDKIKLVPAGTGRVEVVTPGGRFLYTLDGELVSSVDLTWDGYLALPEGGERRAVPTPFALRLFATPIVPWVVMMLGFVVLYRLDRGIKRRPSRDSCEA